MKLSVALKKWAVDKKLVKAGASEDDFRKAIGGALATEDLSIEDYTELSAPEGEEEANEFGKQLEVLSKGLADLTAKLSEKPDEKKVKVKAKTKAVEPEEDEDEDEDELPVKTTKSDEKKEFEGKPGWFKKMVAKYGSSDDDGTGNVQVKGAWENYEDTKKGLVYPEMTKSGRAHPLAGRPVTDMGHSLNTASQLDKAVCGSFAKLLVATAQKGGSKTFGFQSLPQHDKELLYYAMNEMEWGGASDGGLFADIKGKLTPLQQKALIDDATSGGIEAAPIVFDDEIIQAPLLNGELYPLVHVKPLDRGRRVEGVATGTVTGSWGGVDDTAIALFNTASYVSAFDTTIFRWEGAIRIGLDFLSDTPIDFGAHITEQYGERLLEDLDDVIATGNGTTQPEGIMNKSGTTSVAWGGATSIGNYESLRFGVVKAEHRPGLTNTAVFVGTEDSYQRALAIPVGASDARRLSQTVTMPNYDGYQWMQRPYKINESLANTQIFYAILGRYRMYRRRGLTMRSSTEGDTLIRANEMLITVTARYGGQLERGACAAKTTTAPA